MVKQKRYKTVKIKTPVGKTFCAKVKKVKGRKDTYQLASPLKECRRKRRR